MSVEIRGLTKRFGDVTVLDKVDLSIEQGEFAVLVGPSGCGKSTLLRCLAGLEQPTDGTIAIAGADVTQLSPKQRDIAMVFQSYALYPHMTVRDNMSFALRLRKMAAGEVESRVTEAAGLLGLNDLLDRLPRELSGGQRQRVAMGRAIVRRPKVFLFDEPLSNLDAALRVQMRAELARLHARLKATMVYVTHDQTEAMTLADRIVVLNGGIVQQVGQPLELYRTPRNRFVAGFIGSPAINLLPAELVPLELPAGAVTVGVRPEDISLVSPDAAAERSDTITATVEVVEALGHESYIHLRAAREAVVARVESDHGCTIGATMGIAMSRSAIHCFDQHGERIS